MRCLILFCLFSFLRKQALTFPEKCFLRRTDTHHNMRKRTPMIKVNADTVRKGNFVTIIFLPSEIESNLKGKNLLPLGANSFFLE